MKVWSKESLVDYGFYTAGCCLLSAALAMFVAPNQIAPGGVSGLAVVFEYLTAIPIGVWTLFINLPLLFLAFRFLGRAYAARSLFCVFVSSFLIDFFERLLPVYTGDKLLASIISGGMMGAGLALVFMRGASTGGTDILSGLLQRKWPHIPMGRLLMLIDGLVILISALVFQSLETALYSLIAVFVNTSVIDSLLYGTEKGKLVYVISANGDKIADAILKTLNRGCTLLKARGGYSRSDLQVVLVAVRRQQYYPLRSLVHTLDASAFLMVTDYTEVFGEGFKKFSEK